MAAALTAEPPAEFARLVFLGDVYAGSRQRAPAIDPMLVAALQSADLVVANCAGPVVRRPHLPVRSWLKQRRHMDAGALLGVISAMGVETERLALSVANSHALDQSVAGFEETVDTLKALQVRVIGAAQRGLVQTVRAGSLHVGLLAFAEPERHARRLRRHVVTAGDLAASHWLTGEDRQPDLVCAFPHWDRWKARRPGLRALDRAGRLAERGISLVAGHHPSRLQPLERVGNAYVAYGLGVFHGRGAARSLADRVGAMLVVDVSTARRERGRIAAYELFPFVRLAEASRDRIVPLEYAPPELRSQAEATFAHLASVRC
ncbi:CapA family protein [Arvimicrobium flavum]|uniref:CapA family protein n=1 Tax=Arvimicrobium flavum TaxID=3393320 RepID=UPI00237B8D4E|nr:CapA family protein [Mesorhizobium shangrilense]